MRIVIYEEEITTKSQNLIKAIRDMFVNDPAVTIRIKNKSKKNTKKKEEILKKEIESADYSFIRDNNVPIATQIYEFIKLKTGEQVPIEFIENLIKKFNK